MNLIKQTSILVIILLLPFCGCKDIYIPDELNSNSKILVINGAITNNGGPHRVTINWASSFLSSSSPEPVTDATVKIVDNIGQTYPLKQIDQGIYETDYGQLIGTPGKSYTLNISLSDGTSYQSETIAMLQPINFNTLYAEIGELGCLTEKPDGSYVEKIEKGLKIYADIIVTTNEKHYLRFEPNLATQSYFLIDVIDGLTGSTKTIMVRCIDVSSMNNVPNVKTTIKSDTEQIIKKHPLGFMPYIIKTKYYNKTVEINGVSTTQSTPTQSIPDGWIISANLYDVPQSEYHYYKKVAEQLEATNQIFDPLPSFIRGNIICTSDSMQQVLGYFSVSAKTTLSKGMKWSPGQSSIKTVEISDYPYAPGTSIRTESNYPEGWVTFK